MNSQKYYCLFLVFLMCVIDADESADIKIDVKATTYAPVKLMVGVMQEDQELEKMVHVLKKDLSFTGQFETKDKRFNSNSLKKQIKKLASEQYPLVLFLSKSKTDIIEWRLYNTLNICMIKGKKYNKRGNNVRGWAHNIADAVWHTLTSQDGFFSTKIAFCKKIKRKNKHQKHIFVTDYDGSHRQRLVATPTINMAPRWNADKNNPLLFYSEYTKANVRLMTITMTRRRKIASNYDGLNMLPSFSQDGDKLVYCASRGDGTCQLYYYGPPQKNSKKVSSFDQFNIKKKEFKRITSNQGNNVSPSFSADGRRVFFCSDFQTKRPQLYCYDFFTNKLAQITKGSYCACPSYCHKKQQVAYAQMKDGVMQLFIYDVATKTHQQVTYDNANKEECSWSPCGNYLVFCQTKGRTSRIALLNLPTNKRHFITSSNDHCSYPDWSPEYKEFPIVV